MESKTSSPPRPTSKAPGAGAYDDELSQSAAATSVSRFWRHHKLKIEGLLNCKCYSNLVPVGIKAFLPDPHSTLSLGVHCVYNDTMPSLPDSNLDQKHMGQSKLFEYMCMTYFLNEGVKNQEYVKECPVNLKEKYKKSSSIAPFFNLKYQTWKFISDQTAALDIDFSSFWDCSEGTDHEIEPKHLSFKKPFNLVSGIDIKIQDGEGYTMGADIIRGIDKFLKLIDNEKGYRQIVAIKGKLADGMDHVKKVYMFTVNKKLLHKIFPSLFNNEDGDDIDKTKFNAIKKHLFNFKVSRLIFKRIADNGVFELETDGITQVDKRKIILKLMKKDKGPSMIILKKYFKYKETNDGLVTESKKSEKEDGEKSKTLATPVEAAPAEDYIEMLQTALDTVITTCSIKTGLGLVEEFHEISSKSSPKILIEEIEKLKPNDEDTKRKIQAIFYKKGKRNTDKYITNGLQKLLRGIIMLPIYKAKIKETDSAVRKFLSTGPEEEEEIGEKGETKETTEEEDDEAKPCFSLKPCSLQRTSQMKFHVESISRVAKVIPTCDFKMFEYDKHEPGFPTLLFGKVYKNSKSGANAAVKGALGKVKKSNDIIWSDLSDRAKGKTGKPQKNGLHAFKRIISKHYNIKRHYEATIKFQKVVYTNTELKNELIDELKSQISSAEIEGIAEDAVEKMIDEIYKHYTKHPPKEKDARKKNQKPNQKTKNPGGGGTKIQSGGGFKENKHFWTQLLLFQLYSITNLNCDIVNRNGDNPIWEIIIQLVNTMMSSLRGIELPIMEPITTILGKHINKDDEEEFYDLVYSPINSVIYALQKLKASERREEVEVQKAFEAEKAVKSGKNASTPSSTFGSAMRFSSPNSYSYKTTSTVHRSQIEREKEERLFKIREETRRRQKKIEAERSGKNINFQTLPPRAKSGRRGTREQSVSNTPGGGRRKKRTRKKRKKKKHSRRKIRK